MLRFIHNITASIDQNISTANTLISDCVPESSINRETTFKQGVKKGSLGSCLASHFQLQHVPIFASNLAILQFINIYFSPRPGFYPPNPNCNYVDLTQTHAAPSPPTEWKLISLNIFLKYLFITISQGPCRHFQLLLSCGCNCLHANGRQTIVVNEVRPRGSEPDFIKS